MNALPPPAAPLTRRDLAFGLLIFLAAFRLFWDAPVIQMGDSKYTLLLTQNLLSHGSFVLDRYPIPHKAPLSVEDTVFDGDTYQIEIFDGHYYYYFPPGSSILSAPFVLLSDAFGQSVFGPDGVYGEDREAVMQHRLASLLMAALAAGFYLTARRLLPVGWSAVVALGAALGTQVWSTASRALWGHTWGIALLGGALYLLLARETGGRRLRPVLLATVLSWSYFVRPTNSLFIIGITVYVLIHHRSDFVRYAATGAAWFVAFAAYSRAHFGRILPHYYGAGRLETTHFREALAGNLFSPSRGALVFVPAALFVLGLLAWHWRRLPRRRLVWLALAASAAHLLAVSCFSPWFGGWCYGPRYTTELVPWFVLLAVLGTRAALDRHADPRLPPGVLAWRVTLAAGTVLVLLSVLINRRGATDLVTARWNMFPVAVDDAPWRVWDWRYPQFLAGIIPRPLPGVFPRLNDRRVEFGRQGGAAFEWEGWSSGDPTFCWTDERRATLIFAADDLRANRLRMCFAPFLQGRKLYRQRIDLRLNDRPLAVFNDYSPEPQEYVFGLPPGALRRNNVLTFRLPYAASPKSVNKSSADDRALGIGLRWLELKGQPVAASAGGTTLP